MVRRGIDLDATLRQVADRWERNQPFIAASEICDLPLIPADVVPMPSPVVMQAHRSVGISGTTALGEFEGKLGAFWAEHRLTGDNSLERPYAHIYPRLTTRSTSYTVHLRVQPLPESQRNRTFFLKAEEVQGVGEFRGSFLIERYLDSNSAGLVDRAGNPAILPANGDATGLALGPYRFRVVSSQQFTP